MSSAATIIPDRLRSNPRHFFFLELLVDSDFDKKSFLDLVFSFRHNHTLRYVTLIRTGNDESTDGKPVVQRSTKELRLLIKEILTLPRLASLDFENFNEDDMGEFNDLLLKSGKRVQLQ